MPGDHAHKRMGALIRRRRGLRFRSRDEAAAQSNVGRQTWTDVENGVSRNYNNATIERMMIALGWSVDSWDRMLAGQEPLEAPESGLSRLDQLEDRFTRLEARVDEIRLLLARLPGPPPNDRPVPPAR